MLMITSVSIVHFSHFPPLKEGIIMYTHIILDNTVSKRVIKFKHQQGKRKSNNKKTTVRFES